MSEDANHHHVERQARYAHTKVCLSRQAMEPAQPLLQTTEFDYKVSASRRIPGTSLVGQLCWGPNKPWEHKESRARTGANVPGGIMSLPKFRQKHHIQSSPPRFPPGSYQEADRNLLRSDMRLVHLRVIPEEIARTKASNHAPPGRCQPGLPRPSRCTGNYAPLQPEACRYI